MLPEWTMRSTRHFGWHMAAGQVLFLGMARLRIASFLRVFWLEESAFLIAPSARANNIRVRTLNFDELIEHSKDERYELEPKFIERAMGLGHVCLGVLSGTTLMAYAWYGRKDAELSPDLFVSVGEETAYTYKWLTLPEFRKNHCLAMNLHHALLTTVLPGTKRLACLVDASNLVSRMACNKIGFKGAGWLCVIGCSPLPLCRFLKGIRPEDRLIITSSRSIET